MSDFSPTGGNEGYGACDDAPAVWFASAIALAAGITAAKVFSKVWRRDVLR